MQIFTQLLEKSNFYYEGMIFSCAMLNLAVAYYLYGKATAHTDKAIGHLRQYQAKNNKKFKA
jgi:hypothetical protein